MSDSQYPFGSSTLAPPQDPPPYAYGPPSKYPSAWDVIDKTRKDLRAEIQQLRAENKAIKTEQEEMKKMIEELKRSQNQNSRTKCSNIAYVTYDPPALDGNAEYYREYSRPT